MSPVDNHATALTVAKFGGTSVADFTAMSRSAAIIKNNPAARIVLISACSGVTNLLVELANGVNESDRRQQLLTRLGQIITACSANCNRQRRWLQKSIAY